MTHSSDSSSHDGGTNDDSLESTQPDSTQQNWALTKKSLDRFLDYLSPDREEAGKKYEALRTRLVRFFEWRGCNSPDLQTDRTIDRVMRKINEGQVISNLTPYILTVARLVAKEEWKERKRLCSLEDEVEDTLHSSVPDPSSKLEANEPDRRLSCFDHCLEGLSADNRDLILSYYQEDGRAKIDWRKQLAEQLGIPLNALRIRVHRIRKSLEQCIEDCLAQFA